MRSTSKAVLIGISLCAACGVDEKTMSDYPAAVVSDAGATTGNAPNQSGLDAGMTTGAAPEASNVPPPATRSPDAVEDACASLVVQGASATPEMLIVLDRSGSMNPDNNEQMADRWQGSRAALTQVTADFDERINFGLMTFPGPAPAGTRAQDSCAPGMLNVPVGASKADAIAMSLQSMNAEGRTPTTLALQEALKVLGAVQTGPDQLTIPKYVLLVTDGDPNCSGSTGRGADEAARAQTIAAIDALRMAGIKTFVVGYQTASSNFVDQMDRMAAAGGTGATQHRSVENSDDLAMTVAEIAKKAVSCSYQLQYAVPDPKYVLVTVGGAPKNREQMDNGWRLEDDKRTVSLVGAACEELQQGKVLKVEVKCEITPIF